MPRVGTAMLILKRGLEVDIEDFIPHVTDETDEDREPRFEACDPDEEDVGNPVSGIGWVIDGELPVCMQQHEDVFLKLIGLESHLGNGTVTDISEAFREILRYGVEVGIRYAHAHPRSVALAASKEPAAS